MSGPHNAFREFWLLAADLGFAVGVVVVCRVVGHRKPLRVQPMSVGHALVCSRCATTVVWPSA